MARNKDIGLKWARHDGKPADETTAVDLLETRVDFIEISGLVSGPLRALGALDESYNNMLMECYGDSPADGLIGADILSKHRAIIDYGTCVYIRSIDWEAKGQGSEKK